MIIKSPGDVSFFKQKKGQKTTKNPVYHPMTQAHIEQYLNNHLTTRYPTVTRWLAARLTTENFRGLPLTALVGLLIVTMMTLSEVAENIVNTEMMVQVDTAFTHWLFQARTSDMSQFFYGVTWMGSIYATVGALVIGSIVLFRQHKRRNVFILWFVVVGMAASVQLGKRTFVRARPRRWPIIPKRATRFPVVIRPRLWLCTGCSGTGSSGVFAGIGG